MKKVILIMIIAVLGVFNLAAQSSIAHVNTQRVLDTMPSRKDAVKQMELFEDRAMAELQETQAKLQSDYQKLMAEKDKMVPTAYKFEETRLMKKSQEFQQRQQELDQEIQILGQELNEPILDRVQKAIEIVCKAEKIDYVIDESALLYSKGRDITNKVIQEVMRIEAAAAANSSTSN